MRLDIYQIDAFTNKVFGGNPAAVCLLDKWLPDSTLQRIAQENNLSETAFFVPKGGKLSLRWFTPVSEVDLCGHATLATAYVIFNHTDYMQQEITFSTKSGNLTVKKTKHGITMDFPSWDIKPIKNNTVLTDAIGSKPLAIYHGKYWLAEFKTENDIICLSPDFKALYSIDDINFLIATAPSDNKDIDFVSRFFCPKLGIDEDPVTGSAHCILTPFWSKRLNKKVLNAYQASERGGYIRCELGNNRVKLSGNATLYLKGSIYV